MKKCGYAPAPDLAVAGRIRQNSDCEINAVLIPAALVLKGVDLNPVAHGTCIVAFFVVANSAQSQSIVDTPQEAREIVDQVLSALETSGFAESEYFSNESTGILPRRWTGPSQAADAVRRSQDAAEAEAALIEFSDELQKTGYRSEVRFATLRNGEVVDGARIRYRAIGRRRVYSVQELSTSRTPVDLPIGIYHVWAERNGVQSAIPAVFQIDERQEAVELIEAEH